jgi:phosphonate transport system permease protein
VLAAVAISWAASAPLLGRLSAERRWSNFLDFAGGLVPAPVRASGDWSEALPWAGGLLADGGWAALLNTLGIATTAILISGALVLPFLPLASRMLSRLDPCGVAAGRVGPFERVFWRVVGPLVRFGFVIARSIPEYLLAFLFLSLLGLQVWPLVLALAIHNFGILGRLGGEVVENADSAAATLVRASGAGRGGVFATTIFPAVFNRFLIYFFYRWETCVKDATVLGMLGLLTLGKLIALSKGFFWDRMFFYVLLSASVIIAGDLVSSWLRRRLR